MDINYYLDANNTDRTQEVEDMFDTTLQDITEDPALIAELVNDLLFHWIHGTRETPLMVMVKNNFLDLNK